MKLDRIVGINILMWMVMMAYAQASPDYLGSDKYYYDRDYFRQFIKDNRVKSIEYTHEFYDSLGQTIRSIKGVVCFDTLGRPTLSGKYNSKNHLTNLYSYVFSYGQKVTNKKNVSGRNKFIYYSSDLSDAKKKELYHGHLKRVIVQNDTALFCFNIHGKKKVLAECYIADGFGNNRKSIFIRDKDTTEITYLFDYDHKSFQSTTIKKGQKMLVSIGMLNKENRIINEYFYWGNYEELVVQDLWHLVPQLSVVYTISADGLIQLKRMWDRNHIFPITYVVRKENEAVKYKYEYYSK